MRILLVITKAEIGGAQMSVLALAREFKKNGHEVAVGFGQGDFLMAELSKDNIACVRFENLVRTHNPLKNLAFIFEFKKYLDANQFDAIHINSSNALIAGLGAKLAKNKAKTIFTFRGLSLLDENYNKNKFLKSAYKTYFKFFLKYIKQKVFVSRDNYAFALKEKIVKTGAVINNGIDSRALEFYEKEQAKNLLAGHLDLDLSGKLILGSIGRLCYAKNYEFLITIFPKLIKVLPNAILIIIGGGEKEYELKKLAYKYNLEKKIFFCGSLNNAGKYIKAFDIFTLPSRYEGLSITLIEALNSGVPILASAVGGNAELLDDSLEQLFELNNRDDYISKLATIAQNPDLGQKLGENNLISAKKFDIAKTAAEYLKIYQV